MEEAPRKRSASTVAVTIISVIIILVLAFLFYYFTVKLSLTNDEESPSGNTNQVSKPAVVPTNVITFLPPETLPSTQQSGNCFANSIAQPFRQDAWRCTVGNAISDPCFETAPSTGSGQAKGFVFCQMNPLTSDSFLIKLTKALPSPEAPVNKQTNWAWFLTLKGGIICSPFTGTRPFFGAGPDAQVAYYGCKSDNKDQQIVLLGDLIEGNVWKANEAILIKTGTAWTISSTQQVDIETVWK